MFKYKYEEKGRDKEDHNEICNNNTTTINVTVLHMYILIGQM